MDLLVTSEAREKLPSNRHHEQNCTQLLPDALSVAQPTVSKRWRETEQTPKRRKSCRLVKAA